MLSSKDSASALYNAPKLLDILNILSCTVLVDGGLPRSWFMTECGQSFWRPLLLWLIDYGNDQLTSNSLFMFRALQTSVALFQKVLYLNPPLQDVFCRLLYEILEQHNKKSSYMSGYLKYILHQLIIVDDKVTFNFKNLYPMSMFQKSHQIQLPLSSTFGDILEVLLKFKYLIFLPYNNNSSDTAETTNIVATANETHESTKKKVSAKTLPPPPIAEHSYASDPVLYSGNVAVSKRKLRHPEHKPSQSESSSNTGALPRPATMDPNLTMNFYISQIMGHPIPPAMKVGQVLQILYEIGDLNSTPTLLYSVGKGPDSEVAPACFALSMIMTQNSIMTLFERFALMGGLSLLLPPQENRSCLTGPINSVSLFTKLISLPGYAKVFLQDRIKAELLLRLMLGVKETKDGRK